MMTIFQEKWLLSWAWSTKVAPGNWRVYREELNIADNSFDNKDLETAPKEDNAGATGAEAFISGGNNEKEEDIS